ncbi:TonB-dependent receptor [Sphingobium sp. BS19]|nr:TonB-dependent receptor [Sphingobium sp. BS19]
MQQSRPQGSLYGKNTLGGAVVVETQKPNLTDTTGFAEGTIGNSGILRAKGAISTPIADGVAVMLGGRAKHANAFDYNVTTGKRPPDTDGWGLIGAVRYAKDDLEININGDYDDLKNSGPLYHTVRFRDSFQYSSLFTPRAPLPTRPLLDLGPRELVTDTLSSNYASNIDGYENRTVHGLTANISYDFAAFTLKSTSSWRGFELDALSNVGSVGLPLFNVLTDIEQDQYSQEITLVSESGKRFEWILGALYYHEVFTYVQDSIDFRGRLTNNVGGDNAGITPTVTNVNARQPTDTFAVYGQVGYRLTDALKVTVGLRYARDKRASNKIQTSTINFGKPTQFNPVIFPGTTVTNPITTNESATWDDLLPEAVIQYEINDDVSIYAKANKSYRPGGYSPQRTATAPTRFEKESSWTYEAGLRTKAFDGRATFNLTGFYTQWKDQQVQVIAQTEFAVANNDAHMAGLELESRFEVTPEFQAGLALAWLPKADYSSGLLQVRDVVTGIGRNIPAKGNRMPYASKWSGSVFGQYKKEFGDGWELMLRADVSNMSSQFRIAGNPEIVSPSFTSLDSRVALTKGAYSIAFWGHNLLNERYYGSTTSLPFADSTPISDPRTYGLTIGVRY